MNQFYWEQYEKLVDMPLKLHYLVYLYDWLDVAVQPIVPQANQFPYQNLHNSSNLIASIVVPFIYVCSDNKLYECHDEWV